MTHEAICQLYDFQPYDDPAAGYCSVSLCIDDAEYFFACLSIDATDNIQIDRVDYMTDGSIGNLEFCWSQTIEYSAWDRLHLDDDISTDVQPAELAQWLRESSEFRKIVVWQVRRTAAVMARLAAEEAE